MLLRPAQPADAAAVARVHVRSWQVAYRGLLPDEYLDGLQPEDRAPHYTFGDRGPGRPVPGSRRPGPRETSTGLEAGSCTPSTSIPHAGTEVSAAP